MENKTILTKTNWRSFADKLTSLAKSEGQSRFLDRAFEFLNGFVTVDSCSVFKVSTDKTSGAQHLCSFGRLKPEVTDFLAEDYVKNGFKNDPMVQTALLSSKARVRHLPDSQYSPAYRNQFFKKAKLVDKVSFIHASRQVIFLVNFYRTENHGQFKTQDFNDLKRLAPIIGRFVLRHAQLTQDNSSIGNAYEQRILRLIQDNTQVFAKLSPKEKDVCKHILLSCEEKEIAKLMKISVNTVITHRRRLYGKLNIKSKTELFQLAFMTQP